MNTIERSLERVFRQSTRQQYNDGLNWYLDARRQAEDIAAYYGISTERICAVIAALSPQCPWSDNIEYAGQFLDAVYRDIPIASLKMLPTQQRRKVAFNCLLYGPGQLSGLKVVSFYNNLVDPIDNDYDVTIDTHIVKASGLNHTKKITPVTYHQVADTIRLLSAHARILASQYQSIVWIVQRSYT